MGTSKWRSEPMIANTKRKTALGTINRRLLNCYQDKNTNNKRRDKRMRLSVETSQT